MGGIAARVGTVGLVILALPLILIVCFAFEASYLLAIDARFLEYFSVGDYINRIIVLTLEILVAIVVAAALGAVVFARFRSRATSILRDFVNDSFRIEFAHALTRLYAILRLGAIILLATGVALFVAGSVFPIVRMARLAGLIAVVLAVLATITYGTLRSIRRTPSKRRKAALAAGAAATVMVFIILACGFGAGLARLDATSNDFTIHTTDGRTIDGVFVERLESGIVYREPGAAGADFIPSGQIASVELF